MNKADTAGHVVAIKQAVARQLPEDEHDHTATWVYETAVKVLAERLGDSVLTKVEADWAAEAVNRYPTFTAAIRKRQERVVAKLRAWARR